MATSTSYEDKVKFFKARRTMIEMFIDRGILPTDDPNLEMSIDEFVFMLNSDSMIDIVAKHPTSGILYYAHFMIETRGITKRDFLSTIDRIRAENEERIDESGINIIIIYDHNLINNTVKKELLNNEAFAGIEFFLYRELQFNITKNKIVPQHIPLSKEEGAEVLENYRCTKPMLPRLLVTDPVARYFGMKPGTICKIIRISLSVGEYVTYRLVR
jgi:DNA-directed RNA polymerase I, II, and III subunit RPABC1